MRSYDGFPRKAENQGRLLLVFYFYAMRSEPFGDEGGFFDCFSSLVLDYLSALCYNDDEYGFSEV